MSKKSKRKEIQKRKYTISIILIVIWIIILFVMLYWGGRKNNQSTTKPDNFEDSPMNVDISDSSEEDTIPIQVDEVEKVSINLGSGMRIVDVGKYTGIFMEDGSDEFVSGIMMITVINEGEDTIQYAEINLQVGEEVAKFSLTTLTPGSRMILLEQSRMEYVSETYSTAVAENVVVFPEPLDLYENQIDIQILDDAINVSNISDGDIGGDIVIYYKNSADDVFYGGITYRVRIEGGLKAGEIKQIVASHFSEKGSTIMFVTCGEN